ncbi:MAG: hypothetical protein HY653_06460, partial [Acidobacteria bacterium]|nr:hypothetical protein [Acidobacteriota bacterium]
MNSARRFQIGLLLSALCVIALEAHAQASWGLAVDGQGQFYFCDITRDRVWKLDREGKLHLLLTETHCHALMLGYDGNVYGEDIGAEGSSRRGETGVSLWKLTPQGEQRFLLPPTTEPDPSVWIVRDPEGNTYAWKGNPSAKSKSQILKRTPSGSVSVLAGSEWGNTDGRGPDAKFGNVGGMAVAPDGTLYVADEGNLRRVEPDGTVTTLARGLLSTDTGGLPGYGGLFNHSLGVAVDAQNNVYVVDFRNRRILKRTPEGSVTTLAQSTGIANALTNSAWGWRPTGIAITANEIYLMEDWPLPRLAADLVGSPRIRKAHPNGTLSTVAQVASPSMRTL